MTYVLCAIERGHRRTLAKGLPDAAAARWLELELERRLGLVDEPMAGEGVAHTLDGGLR